jgi:hypothetical protein
MKRTATILQRGNQLIGIAANRELRRVPLDWRHPTDEAGEYLPLENRDRMGLETELEELLAEGRTHEELEAFYMPDFSGVPDERMGVAVYETTSEGTPTTPVFPATREGLYQLLGYCAANCATFADFQTDMDGWAQLLGLMHVLDGKEAS